MGEKVTKEQSAGFLIEYAAAVIRELPEELRTEVFAKFCTFCGREDPRCMCMRDD